MPPNVAEVTSWQKSTQMLLVHQVMELLGLAEKEVMELFEEGELKGRYFKSSNRVLFFPQAVENFLQGASHDSNYKNKQTTTFNNIKQASSSLAVSSITTSCDIDTFVKSQVVNSDENTDIADARPNHVDDNTPKENLSLLVNTKAILNKVAEYGALTDHAKNKICIEAYDNSKKVENSINLNLVKILDLNLKPRNKSNPAGIWQLDLRLAKHKYKNNERLQKLLGKKTAWDLKNGEEASIKYLNTELGRLIVDGGHTNNRVVATAANELAIMVNLDAKRVSTALTISAQQNKIQGFKTEKEMRSKIGFWQHVIGDLPLEYVSYNLLFEIINTLHESGLDKSSLTNYIVAINKPMKLALDSGWIPHRINLTTFQSDQRPLFPEIAFDTKIRIIKNYSKTVQEQHYMHSSETSGQRNGSILNLKENQIVRDKGHIYWGNSKSGKQLNTPLSQDMAKYIEQAIKYKRDNNIKSPYVFAMNNQNKLPKIDYKRWHKATKAERIEPIFIDGKEYRYLPHHWRHEMATELRESGAELADIMEAGGWTSYDGVLRYLHNNNMSKANMLLDERNKTRA